MQQIEAFVVRPASKAVNTTTAPVCPLTLVQYAMLFEYFSDRPLRAGCILQYSQHGTVATQHSGLGRGEETTRSTARVSDTFTKLLPRLTILHNSRSTQYRWGVINSWSMIRTD